MPGNCRYRMASESSEVVAEPSDPGSAVTRRSALAGGAFTAGAALAGQAALSALPRPALARGLRRWRMVTSWPRGLPGVGTGAQRIADRITALSGGSLTVDLYAGGELVPPLQTFDAVADGTADVAHDATYYHAGKVEAATLFATFPFGLTAGELTGWIHFGGGQALWEALYEPFGVKPFLAGNSGTQMLGWFRKEINTVDDLKGMKFRTGGDAGRVLAKLGATVVSLPAGEIYQALRSGTIDAAEWVGPYNDLAFGLHQIAPYYYTPGFHEPGPGLELIVNAEAYRSLPADLQAIVRESARAACDDIFAEYTAHNGPALRTLVQTYGVQIKVLPRDVLEALGDAANQVLLDISARGGLTQRIVDSYLAFRREVMPWTRVGEHAFLQARQLPMPHGGRTY